MTGPYLKMRFRLFVPNAVRKKLIDRINQKSSVYAWQKTHLVGREGFSWAYLGTLRDSLGSLLASLGPLLGSLGQLLGGSLGPALLKPSGPRGSKTATKCPKTVPKAAQATKRELKRTPHKLLFDVFFRSPFLDPLQDSLEEGFLDALCPKN